MKIITNNLEKFQADQKVICEKPIRYFCHHCNSELEITKEDIKKVPVKLCDSEEIIEGLGFYCPVCNGLNVTG